MALVVEPTADVALDDSRHASVIVSASAEIRTEKYEREFL